ncbi:MlaD family protein [Mycolicibacterium setense]|uniref:MlaD family protein n=1 Tax=Mycolicibacterium setense TaxID=431269 RepID=UPI0009E27BBA|nr:MCE family protein [Mycolicibacterium setense]MCV7112195.1 MCE family protein [Mycolicibacterium setense]
MVDLDGNHFTARQLIRRGTVALVVVGVVASVLLVKSTGMFDRSLHVVAELRNIGDGLPARSDVKFRGVLVGAVESVTPGTAEQPSQVHIRLDSAYAQGIPVGVAARVVPSNAFAVSSLQLVETTNGSAGPIRDGGRITEDTTLPTVLFQTTLTKLRDILAAAGRGRDDHTIGVLAAVAAATNNRRGQLLTSASELNRLIDELNAVVATDEGPSTISALSEAARGLSATAPDLVGALHEAVEPMRALVEQRRSLEDFLAAATRTTATSVESLDNQTDRLVHITTDLTPVLGVLAQNARHFVPISQRMTRFSDTFFAEVWDSELDTARGRVNLSFTPSYTYTRADCPRYGALSGPSCFTAPEVPVRADLPEVLMPQNYQPPPDLAPPPGTVIGENGNLVAVGPPLLAPQVPPADPYPPLPPGISPAPPVPGSAAPASFGGNVGPVGSGLERDRLGEITDEPATVATQLILGPVARGTVVTRTPPAAKPKP